MGSSDRLPPALVTEGIESRTLFAAAEKADAPAMMTLLMSASTMRSFWKVRGYQPAEQH